MLNSAGVVCSTYPYSPSTPGPSTTQPSSGTEGGNRTLGILDDEESVTVEPPDVTTTVQTKLEPGMYVRVNDCDSRSLS